jgi:hypothetical protein
MAQLATSFTQAQSNVEPSDDDWDNAPAAHDAVGSVLAEDDDLKEWGINPFLIGSYGRRVSIRRVYDVDMFCRLDKYPEGVTPSVVLDRVYDALVEEYGEDAVTRYDRSVTVLVPDMEGLYVDVVPARQAGGVWEIPTKDGDWIETNPIRLGELKEDKNADTDGLYVPCVKLLRQVRRTILGKATTKPGGFTVEMALYTAHDEGLVSGDTMAKFFTTAIEGVADVFNRVANEDFQMPDPSMDGEVLEFDAGADWDTAATKFAAAAATAREAYEMDEDKAGKAALLLQSIFGENDDYDQVFPMPAGYDKDGNARAKVNERKPGDSRVPGGDLRFG